MGKQSYKEREKKRREEEILTSAERLLLERGYANLSMDDLAEYVGLSKPTLYQHFKSKEELAARVFMRGFEETENFLAQPLDEPAIDRLTNLMRWSITKRYSAGNFMAGLRPDTLWNAIRGNIDIEARKQRVHTYVSVLVETAKSEGAINTDLPTLIVVQSMFCLQWALHNPALQEQLAGSPEALQSTIDSLIHVFLRGVTPARNVQ
jgi:AcrR family transcriptional regulator